MMGEEMDWAGLVAGENEEWPYEQMQTPMNTNKRFDPRNLFVKHLPESMTSTELRTLFAEFGPIASAKVIVEPSTLRSKGFGFVKFDLCESAKNAALSMHKRVIPPNKQLCVEPALVSAPATQPPQPTPAIYIKNLPDSITKEELREMCEVYGAVEKCCVLSDEVRSRSRGVAVVQFTLARHAAAAKEGLNKKRINETTAESTILDVRFARIPYQDANVPKNAKQRSDFHGPPTEKESTEPKFTDSAEGINLFVFHLPDEWNEAHLSALFSPYGNISSIKVMVHTHGERANMSKGFGFVKFENEADGLKALAALNGHKVGTKRIKVALKKSK